MLHVALAGLLAGSLALSPPDGTGDAKQAPNADKPAAESVATPGVFETAQAPQSITVDTYAQGRPAAEAPIKLWVQYAYGNASEIYDRQGETRDLTFAGGAGGNREAVSQRVQVGAQINFISFPRFRFGVGGQLGIAKNELNVEGGNDALGVGDLESDFGLQQVKVYGTLRGQTLGLHGGYSFDLGNEQEFGEPVVALGGIRLPTNLANSDGRDAIFFGADFDYPSERFRLFGGIDYYMLQTPDEGSQEAIEDLDNDDFLNFAAGAGVKFGFIELGAAAQIQTRFDQPTLRNVGATSGIGSHIGSVVPYLRLSPPSLPASIYVKGATPDEYFEYGYPIGGANTVKANIGFTVGLSVGFQ